MTDRRKISVFNSFQAGRLFTVALSAVLVLSLTACFDSISDAESDTDDGNGESENPAERDAGIRFMHVAPDGDTVHIYFDDVRIGSNIGFTNANGYIQTAGGEELEGEVEIRLVERADDDEEGDTLFSKTVTFDDDLRVTGLIRGEGEDLSLQLVDEHFDDETEASTMFRLSHFAENKGEVDIYLTAADAGELSDLSPTWESVEPGTVLDMESVSAESAKRLRVAAAGEDEVLFDTGESGDGGYLYFFQGDRIHQVLLDFSADAFQNARGFSLIGSSVFVQSREHTSPVDGLNDARSRFQFTHGVPDAGDIDLEMDDRSIASELEYGHSVDPFIHIAGTRNVQPFDGDSGSSLTVEDPSLDFLRRHEYSVVLVGSHESGEKLWAKGRVSQASRPIDEDEDRIYIHGVNGYLAGPEAVDLVINDVIPGGGYELEFGDYEVFNQAMPIESDENVIQFYEAGTYGVGGEAIAEKEVDVERGESYTAVLVAAPGEDPEILMVRHDIFD